METEDRQPGANEEYCAACGKIIQKQAIACPYCQVPHRQQLAFTPTKSKIAAGVLGLLLGGIGIHKFYLGKVGMGILYILFCWSGIPGIIGFVEGIIYLTMSDQAFAEKYDPAYQA